MEINEIIKRLKEGNNRFISDTSIKKLKDSTRREMLAGGQSPFAVILGCADSRVAPEIVFDTDLGELFTVRVAGNVASISAIASIEFAVVQLNVKVILVKGHSNCGAVTAAVGGGDHGQNLNKLFTHIIPAIEQVPSKNIDEVVKKNAELNAEELVNRSPMIAEAVKSGQLKIIPAFYHLESGEVEFLTE
jgi:carbonic anhydrase